MHHHKMHSHKVVVEEVEEEEEDEDEDAEGVEEEVEEGQHISHRMHNHQSKVHNHQHSIERKESISQVIKRFRHSAHHNLCRVSMGMNEEMSGKTRTESREGKEVRMWWNVQSVICVVGGESRHFCFWTVCCNVLVSSMSR